MFRIKFSVASNFWGVGEEEGKIIEINRKVFPYNEELENWLRYFKGEQVEDLTFGQNEPPIFIDYEVLRGVIEK